MEARGRHYSLRMNGEYTSSTPESIIGAAKVDLPDLVLSQGRSTHNARLDCDVEVCLLELSLLMDLEEFCDCEKLCMTCTLYFHLVMVYIFRTRECCITYVHGAICIIHARSHNLVFVDQDTAHWGLAAQESALALGIAKSTSFLTIRGYTG